MSKTAGATRIYLVCVGQKMHLVRAVTRNHALSHVVASMTTVRIADQNDLVLALGQGLKVEDAAQGETDDLPFKEAQAA